MSNDVRCPYCNKWCEINHDDGYGCEEDRIYHQACNHCDKLFRFGVSIRFDYDAQKAPCLNDDSSDDHMWREFDWGYIKDNRGWPFPYPTKWRCELCSRTTTEDPT